MKDMERRYELVVSAAVVAVFAAFWVIVFAMGDPPEFQEQYVISAVMVVMVATPWVIAVRLLWRAWWARTAARLTTMDGPALLLAAGVAMLPEDRRDWGAAMAAELAQVPGRSSRWWFAAGCAWAALFPPRRGRVPVLVVGGLAAAAVMTAGLATGYALPAMRVFAVTFVALVGALATLIPLPHSRRVRPAAPGPTITIAGVTGVAACIAVTAYFLVKHPTAAEHLPPTTAVIFAAVLAGCMWLALTPPRRLTTHRLARGLGAGAALALGLGFLLTSRLTLNTYGGPVIWVMFAPAVIFFAAATVAAAVGRSFRAGVQAAVWTALVGTLLVFAMWLPETLYRYGIDARLLLDGEMGYSVAENLDDAIGVLVMIPVLGLPFGVIGAAVGRRLRVAPPFRPFSLENPRC